MADQRAAATGSDRISPLRDNDLRASAPRCTGLSKGHQSTGTIPAFHSAGVTTADSLPDRDTGAFSIQRAATGSVTLPVHISRLSRFVVAFFCATPLLAFASLNGADQKSGGVTCVR